MIFIISIDVNPAEENYQELAVLLAYSLKMSQISNYRLICGLFTNRKPSDHIIKLLKRYNVEIVTDLKFTFHNREVPYYLRHYTSYYFSKIYNNFMYLDLDVLVLKPLDDIYKKDIMYLEKIPDDIILKEVKYVPGIDKLKYPIYYNWYQMINQYNRFLYDMDYNLFLKHKECDLEISRRIDKYKNIINTVPQTKGAYYPKHKLDNSYLFHYDGFINSGTLYKLEEYDPLYYKKIKLFLKHILKIELKNDKLYWRDYE